MRKILKKGIHKEFLKLHQFFGAEIRSRHRFRLGHACDALELMTALIIKRESWEKGGKGR